MCIYATLNYILLPKGQILKCPAWMHKVQSGNYAFLLCCSGGSRLQRILPPDRQTSHPRHCRSHFHRRSPGYRKKEKRESQKKKSGWGGRKINLEHDWWVWSVTVCSSNIRWWGRDWVMCSLLFLLTSLPHDCSSPSLLGLRIPSAVCALDNADNVKAFYLGVAFLLLDWTPSSL